MPAKADSPLRKVTLNLYEIDCATLEKHYGRGWSEKVRQLVHVEGTKLRDRSRDPWIIEGPLMEPDA